MKKLKNKVTHIYQRHEKGCGIASLAMVLDRTYDEVLKDFENDFSENGMDLQAAIQYLGNSGFSIVHKYIINYAHKDFAREEMLKPFADRHIIRILHKFDSENGHFAVMDGDGQLYCPEGLSEEEIKQSYMITDIIGLTSLNTVTNK